MSKMARGLSVLFMSLCAAAFAQVAAPAPPNAIPQGTVVLIQLTDKLDTHTVKAGDHFQARLAEPVQATSGITLEADKNQRPCQCRGARAQPVAAQLR